MLDTRTKIERLQDSIDDIARGAGRLSDEAGEMAAQIARIEKASETQESQELSELRRRLDGTEDALMRANRKLMKPVRCECPACGKLFDTKQAGA